MTWRLWRALRRPPTRNPAFRRAYAAPPEPLPWSIGCARWLAVPLAFPLLALAGLLNGLGWSVGIAHLISGERERGAFALLRLAPSGPLGMSWAMATGYFYHHRTFKNVNAPDNLLIRLSLSAAVLAAFGVLVENAFPPDFLALLLLRSLTLGAALLADHIQSLGLAALTGMLAPALTENRVSAQLHAFALYTGAQLVTYLVTLAVGFVVLPGALWRLGLSGWPGELVVNAARLALLVGARELLLRLLWRALEAALSPDPNETRTLLHGRLSRR